MLSQKENHQLLDCSEWRESETTESKTLNGGWGDYSMKYVDLANNKTLSFKALIVSLILAYGSDFPLT